KVDRIAVNLLYGYPIIPPNVFYLRQVCGQVPEVRCHDARDKKDQCTFDFLPNSGSHPDDVSVLASPNSHLSPKNVPPAKGFRWHRPWQPALPIREVRLYN